VAPAAFLLAVTIAVALVRPMLRSDSPKPQPSAAVSATKPAAKPPPRRIYVVRAGDTLASIASRNNITVARLLELNPKVQPTALFIGQKIALR
jgi:LysM repeat protein